ncbi:hypothetical protein CWE12_00550 [Aliidiomarina sedimenti]|uniref:Uncharacterized protein n=1 Tax=Aliidiomarina sedimenti TaxID=1933879 RepID=A0ABY0C1L2_9GAMM|nr:hypothetical protein [Aliidiomarina sedimenti]RUO31528.1 hypothetical protein CWE12_00550 [Aliidiomarina sedimenti]
MPTHTTSTGAMLLILASLLGVGISLYYYLVPMTGVTGTAGALLVVVSSLVLTLCGIILLKVGRGTLAITVRVVVLLGALGTIAAAWFLHEFWLVAVMVVALVGVIIDVVPLKEARK